MFVTLEGPEGAGKSTVMARLAESLRTQGHVVVTTREPGEGKVGAVVREALLHGDDLLPLTELFLFLADRAEHVAKMVRPALANGAIVICDRYIDSNVVYQGHARGIRVEQVRELNRLATGGLSPSLTLLFDVPPEVGLSRVKDPNRLDKEPLAFHTKVRDAYLSEAKGDPDRWVTIDANRPVDEVTADCLLAVSRRMVERTP